MVSQCLDAIYIFLSIFNCFFQVMIQPQNRQMSFSVYTSALAVSDTTTLLNGKLDIYVTSFWITLLTLLVLASKNKNLTHHKIEDG